VFYFQQLLNQGLAGIDQTPIIGTVVGIAYTILLIGFLIGLYQAAMRGGDVQSLGVTAIKFVVIGIILGNWSTAFHGVNDAFNQVAQSIDSSFGAGDLFMDWFNQLNQQFQTDGTTTILSLITGQQSAGLTALLLIVAYVFYAIAVVVFGFFYTLFGGVLYVVGPMVLALMPMAGAGQMAKSYATNLLTWNAWGILYATFAVLIKAIQANQFNSTSGFFGFFQGNLNALLLGFISIFYALAMLLIPFIAKKIVSGDVGASAYSLVKAAGVAVGAAVSGGAGFAAGAGGSAGTGAGASAGGSTASTVGAGAGLASTPPPEPSMAGTTRQGVRSAVEGTAPRGPSPSSDKSGESGGGKGGSGGGGQRSGSGGSDSGRGFQGFRPVGMVQNFAYHAGRFAGAALRQGQSSSSSQEKQT